MQKTFTRNVFSLLYLYVCFFLSPAIGQQNGGFESWSPSGSPPPFDWMYPAGWTTTNAATEFITSGVKRSTDKHGGSYAAQIQTLNIFGTLTRSQLALGNCKINFPEYKLEGNTGGDLLTMIPHQVSFFYKLTIGDPAEYAIADVLIKRASGQAIPDTVFYASFHLQSAATYTEVNILIPKQGINIATDSIVIVFSSNDTNEVATNLLYVDDVSIDFASNNIPIPQDEMALTVFPNPLHAGQSLTINHPGNVFHDVLMIDNSGRIIEGCFDLFQDGDNTILSGIPAIPGLYNLIIDGRYGAGVVVQD
ncbi:MAG: hypothetical protein KBA14_07090 [Saprospiraceae bacterium]|nr:hypothetical protein [Saprospiraceae bacterium]